MYFILLEVYNTGERIQVSVRRLGLEEQELKDYKQEYTKTSTISTSR